MAAARDFAKIVERHELSRKNIHDFKQTMNQNLSHSSAAKMTAKHARKIGSSAHVPEIDRFRITQHPKHRQELIPFGSR